MGETSADLNLMADFLQSIVTSGGELISSCLADEHGCSVW